MQDSLEEKTEFLYSVFAMIGAWEEKKKKYFYLIEKESFVAHIKDALNSKAAFHCWSFYVLHGRCRHPGSLGV